MPKILTIAFVVGGIFIVGIVFLILRCGYRSIVKTLNKYTHTVNSPEEEEDISNPITKLATSQGNDN